MLAASGWPKMPKMPHSSLNLSMQLGDLLYKMPLDYRGPHTFGFHDGHVNRSLAVDVDRDSCAARPANHACRHSRRLSAHQHRISIARRGRHGNSRRRFAEERGDTV